MRKYLYLMLSILFTIGLVIGIRMMSDNTPPTLILPPTPMSIQCATKTALLEGVQAFDGENDISDQVIVENMQAILLHKANYVTYVVSDDDGNVAKASRDLILQDTQSQLTVGNRGVAALVVNTKTPETFKVYEYFFINDACGRDISSEMHYEGEIRFDVVGSYQITLMLKDNEQFADTRTIQILPADNSGNNSDIPNNPTNPDNNNEPVEELPEEENPVNASAPIIVFRQNQVRLPLESTFQFMSHILTIEDNIDGYDLLSRRVRVSNLPNMFVEGTYTVTYLVTNTSGQTGIGELTVIVEGEEPNIDVPIDDEISDNEDNE